MMVLPMMMATTMKMAMMMVVPHDDDYHYYTQDGEDYCSDMIMTHNDGKDNDADS